MVWFFVVSFVDRWFGFYCVLCRQMVFVVVVSFRERWFGFFVVSFKDRWAQAFGEGRPFFFLYQVHHYGAFIQSVMLLSFTIYLSLMLRLLN